MNHVEAKNSLINRVEWRKPLDTYFNFLSFNISESGRSLQEEHSAVTIKNIYKIVFDIDLGDDKLQDELQRMKEEAILQMLHDVFYDQKEIQDIWLNDYIGIYDYAIILRVTRNVLSAIINSPRVNEVETITKDNINRWFIDLNGLIDRENGVYVQGFNKRYEREIERIRKVLFIKKTKLILTTARR